MFSAAARYYAKRAEDVALLMGPIREDVENNPGKRGNPGSRVEVLNRSAIVLVTGAWEGYCEALAAEALFHLVRHAKDPNNLPKKLREQVGKELHAEGPAAAWKLAGKDWRMHLFDRLGDHAVQTALKWNLPLSDRVDSLFQQSLGMERVTDSWTSPRRSFQANRARMDSYVRLRGDIAHGAGATKKVRKSDVTDFRKTAEQLITCMDEAVDDFVLEETGSPLF